ncbi:MAG TPA: NnrS family protein [Wenzhouxiangella sp.]|nr:NnrS family protein [Wenzhouxiangella sp.]
MPTQTLTETLRSETALWACPFRPFFLGASGYAIAAVIGWLGVLLLGWPLAGDHPPMQWHSHEMLFGMVGAAIAGFLLTAMCNWTGSHPLSGRGLQALFGLWLAGRVALWLSALLPHALVASVDIAFFAAVAIYAGRVIIGAGNYRNLPLVAVVSALALANLLFHAGWFMQEPALVRRVELGTVGLIVLLIIIVGGRITPAFTRNWLLRQHRQPEQVRSWPLVEAASMVSAALLVLALLAGAPAPVLAALAAVAGVANAARVIGWRGWCARTDALVWILHAGYAWIPLGLILMAIGVGFGSPVSTVWMHALGPGAMGVMIIGVMTRVALGHTGRPLELPRGAAAIYALILTAATVRLITALGWLPWRGGVMVTTAAWCAAFLLFLWLYLPILVRPRADGRPG